MKWIIGTIFLISIIGGGTYAAVPQQQEEISDFQWRACWQYHGQTYLQPKTQWSDGEITLGWETDRENVPAGVTAIADWVETNKVDCNTVNWTTE